MMSLERDRRAAIIAGLRAGRTVKQISSFNNIAERTVYDVRARYEEEIASGVQPECISSARKAHKRRSDRKGEDFINEVQKLIDDDPGRSMRSIARELDVCERTIRRVVEEDIHYKSYVLKKGQSLSDSTKKRRFEKAKLLLNRLKNPSTRDQLIFFSDEKVFVQDQVVNRRNSRWLCFDKKEVPVVMSSKFPGTLMVLGVVSNEGDVMPPHFFSKGQKVNSEVYLTVMKDVVKPWMENIARGRHYVFQQDGAPAHTSNVTQSWLRENLPEFWEKEVWPPCSPDCNPLDYFVWSVCERDVNKQPHPSLDSLRQKIIDVMGNLNRNMLAKACKRFRSRIEAVIESDGDFF
jgi:transposase